MKPRIHLAPAALLGIALAACHGRDDIGIDAVDVASSDARPDASPDASPDVSTDAGMDATRDAALDVMPDVMDVPHDYVRPPDVARTDPESVMATRRAACEFQAGAWPAETLGTDAPLGTDIPIDHVIVLMKENRSFDHYFSHLPQYGQTDVEVPPPNWSNPRADGTPVRPFHDTDYCIDDVAHSWRASHAEYNNGANDGFVTENDPNGERAMGYETESEIPFYYDLASHFAIGDHYHCSVLGPTLVNRMFSMAATSFGLTENVPTDLDTMDHPVNHIFAELDAAGLDWKDYAESSRTMVVFPYYTVFRRETRPHLVGIDALMSDLAAGTLPAFSLVEPGYGGSGGDRDDEHPPGTPQVGDAWTENIVRAVMASPAWSRTVLFINYDEHGGYADHVPPPPACEPDDYAPHNGSNVPQPGAFDRYGFRVPLIAISPYARRHFVGHGTYDHTSILRFVEARFGLPAMTRRDANATPPYELFDFANPDTSVPTLAHSVPDPAVRARCATQYPSSGFP